MPVSEKSGSRMRRSTTADEIKKLILTRDLKPGDPLPTEAELCETLNVSRSSVREAIRTLSTLDIVDVRHGHGTYVGAMSLDPMVQALVFRGVLSPDGTLNALREVVEVRLALDLALAETIVNGAVGEDAAELSALVDEMVDKASRGEVFLEADRAFHTKLFSVTGNRLAVQLVGAFWDVHTAVIPQLGIAMPEDIQHTAEAHGDMLASALRGDVEGYRQAVIEHYRPLQRSISAATA
ncbi:MULTISPECIES: FadR/GntR family transcriptional regulator [Microbacterium]|uniref:DNA-binding transcriptional regulator, FadR family n=1 Tax=Microbacterium saccharophilum TaxID=1213358 RepID=A0A7Z7D2S0_9MICO|nr:MULTISPECIES: FadR/GntR family transcriptional regulator [Microbacterium]SFI70566.1 DNA-binding transcriptional regulator, FadR family [Microbacterium saccharophilum]